MHSNKYHYIKFINYSALSLWDVKRYTKENISFENSVKLEDVLYPYVESIAKKDLLSNNWQIISKLNFAGELFLRDKSDIYTFKGNLNKVNPDSLIYSKINVRHGCIYYHPQNAIPFAVSSEYPVFKIDTTRVLGDYLVKIIQSFTFKYILSNKVTGISKARVKTADFLDIEVPIPSLSIQKELLQRYNDMCQKAEDMEREALHVQMYINDFFIKSLGVMTQQDDIEQSNKYRYLKLINFQHVSEWGIDIIKKKQKRETFKYPIVKIKDLCQLGSGGTPSRSCPNYYKGNIPWVKTGEVVNDVITETEEHITEEAINNSSAKIYPKGSLIIAMYGQGDTRGRTAKLGIDAATNQACAVLYNIDTNIVNEDYFWYYLQGRYHDLRSFASGNNQPNLNAGKIKEYDVVVPPKEVQNEISVRIKEMKALMKKLKQQAKFVRKRALMDFEKALFQDSIMNHEDRITYGSRQTYGS